MKKYNRFLSLLICVLLILPLFTFMGTGVLAAGEEDTYVLDHRVDGNGYSGPDLQYFSPYRIKARMDGKDITMKNCMFLLYNTTNDETIPVYCTDINVLANPNYVYRRMNLSDSTYAAAAADKIRAILDKGFYLMPIEGESDAEHAVRVQAELKRLGDAAGVPDLTIGEAITGTQSAIWQAAHGRSLVFTDFVHNIYTTDVSESVRYYEICDEERNNGHVVYNGSGGENVSLTAANDAWIGARIDAVYSYLMSLDPLPPSAIVVSPASFQKIDEPTVTSNGDGTYDVTVTTTVKVHMEDGDTLTLTASMGDGLQASTSLHDGTQTVRLTIKNVPADQLDQDIKLSIEGLQSGLDAYLFDAEGDRTTSQSMVGKDDSRLPVYTEITVKPNLTPQDRVLNFYKTTKVATGTDTYERIPLEGITFDLYFVAELNDYLMGRVPLPEAKDYDYPDVADFSLTTDKDGKASINLTQQGMPDGVYLVVERDHPAIQAPVDPFYVFMPSTNADGTGFDYEVTIQPKNDVKGDVRIEKDVISLGNDSASVDAYTNHTWIIGTNIPEDIANGKSFVISDTLDNRLDYMGNMKVQVETVDGQTVVTTLTEGTDYALNVTDVASLSKGMPSDAFTVTLTPAGMAKISTAIGSNRFEDYMLRVYFDARINANAKLGTEIPNQATVKYTNSVNFDFTDESDKPVVYTGGVKLLKVDSADTSTVLSGAVFEVYRSATAEEVAAGGDAITHIPGVSGAVVKVSFFNKENLKGDKVTSVTSDAKGKAGIYGLAYGEYFLLETQAPAGYNLLKEAVKLTIDGTTHTADKTVTVENVKGAILPSTGGIGTTVYFVTGFALMCAGGLILICKKRRMYH